MQESKSYQDITKARLKVCSRYPFFYSSILGLNIIESEATPTITTNGVNLVVNPSFFSLCSPKERRGLIMHENLHVVLNHPVRCSRLPNKGLANDASDYVINGIMYGMIRQEEHENFGGSFMALPEPHLYDERFVDRTVEQVYDILLKENHEPQPQSTGSFEPHPAITDKWNQEKSGSAPLSMESTGGIDTSQSMGEIMEQLETQGNQKMQDALAHGKMMGNMPSDIMRQLGELVKPKVDWREELQAYFAEKALNDFDYSKPNTRLSACAFLMPSITGFSLGDLVFAIDTSGSIPKKELEKFGAEAFDVFDSLEPEKLHILWVDTRVQRHQEFEQGDIPDLQPKGGGGTKFSPAFKFVSDNDINPCCMVYLTDGYCRDFGKEPDYPVLWCLTEDNSSFRPPFGEVMQVNLKCI